MIEDKILEEIVLTSPLVLLGIKDKDILHRANLYLPYSTGFEIECEQKSGYDRKKFEDIPNIMDVDVDLCEQRYRIPNGVNGLVCLFNICYQLRENSLLNFGSGIHYHIDCTGYTPKQMRDALNGEKGFTEYLLEQLDTWHYGGNYNSKGISLSSAHNGSWIRWNVLNTLEFRIGNMSFDYGVIVKQIIHANKLVMEWKKLTQARALYELPFEEVQHEKQIAYQKRVGLSLQSYDYKISKLAESLIPEVTNDTTIVIEEVKKTVNSRLHKLY